LFEVAFLDLQFADYLRNKLMGSSAARRAFSCFRQYHHFGRVPMGRKSSQASLGELHEHCNPCSSDLFPFGAMQHFFKFH
jgi:hypothetical protein